MASARANARVKTRGPVNMKRLNIEGSPSALRRDSFKCQKKIEEWFEGGDFLG
jgi:hypothetical protein